MDRLELEDGEEGTAIDDVQSDDFRVDVNEGRRGDKRFFWMLRFEVPEGRLRPGATVRADPAVGGDRAPPRAPP